MAIATGVLAHTHHDDRNVPGPSFEHEAFNGFPYGLFVLDRDGKLICRNLEAARVIEAMALSEQGLTCCALLGCRGPDTVLASVCLTELAITRARPLPEIRIDIKTADGPLAMWVSAGAIGGTGQRVVLQLRPGVAQDRRQRTEPHWMTGPRLRVRCLGTTIVESAEIALRGAWLDQRTGQLLKYLVAERHRVATVEQIAESIWPGADYAAGASVRYYIHTLRQKIEPRRVRREPSSFITSRAGSYGLNLDQVEVDADEFEARLGRGLALVASDAHVAAAEIEGALALYRGEFLAELPYADWAMSERHRLHDLACAGLSKLAEIRLELRSFDGAVRSLERLASLQPYDESVHRRLMELEIMQGRRSDAVRRYHALRSRMRRTFGHDPDFTPADLAPPKL